VLNDRFYHEQVNTAYKKGKLINTIETYDMQSLVQLKIWDVTGKTRASKYLSTSKVKQKI